MLQGESWKFFNKKNVFNKLRAWLCVLHIPKSIHWFGWYVSLHFNKIIMNDISVGLCLKNFEFFKARPAIEYFSCSRVTQFVSRHEASYLHICTFKRAIHNINYVDWILHNNK